MNSSFDVALTGIRNGLASFESAAEQVSRGPNNPDFVQAVVEMKVAQREVEASVKVLKAVDEMMGSLIDELA